MEAQMKINGAAVRALREQKSWSQEHLASAAGL
jgi:transcriptional regulator with XRE-family HTH domain